MSDSISTLAELKAASQTPTAARNRLTYLFDEGKFTELDAYAAAGDSLAGVITAFGYVEGNPVYAFSQDVTVKDGALTEAQAKKIAKVYDLAAKTGVPVVGIFDSYGADVSDGSKALNAYGELLMWTSNLSGVVPQIAVVAGTCAGCAAMLAESADFTVIAKDAELYVAPNANIKNSAENAAENGTAAVVCEDDKAAVEAAKNILTKLPQNNLSPVPMYEFADPTEAVGGDSDGIAKAVCDGDSVTELNAEYGKASYTALATLGGATVGVVATNKTGDKLTSADCSKIARFVRLCDAYSIPVITVADTEGFDLHGADMVRAGAALAGAYAEASCAKIALVSGKACGMAYIAFAGRNVAADAVYALPEAVIAPMDPVSAAEFLYHDKLKGADDLAAARAQIAKEYAENEGSAFAAAAKGAADEVVTAENVRAAVASVLDVTAGKRLNKRLPKKHNILPL